MIREINSADWPVFCKRLSEQCAGATAKLEVIEPDGIKSERVGGANFQSLEFVKAAGCSDLMVLRLRSEREMIYEMVDPIRILLQPSGAGGDFNVLEIEAESGVSFITFEPAIHGLMFEGLKAT